MSARRDRLTAENLALAREYLTADDLEWWEQATARHATREWCEATRADGIVILGSRPGLRLYEFLEDWLDVRVVDTDEAAIVRGRWAYAEDWPPEVRDEINAADKAWGGWVTTPEARNADPQ